MSRPLDGTRRCRVVIEAETVLPGEGVDSEPRGGTSEGSARGPSSPWHSLPALHHPPSYSTVLPLSLTDLQARIWPVGSHAAPCLGSTLCSPFGTYSLTLPTYPKTPAAPWRAASLPGPQHGRTVGSEDKDGGKGQLWLHCPIPDFPYLLCRIHPANCSPVVQDSTSAE